MGQPRKENSRTKNSIYNFISSIGAQLITIVMNFVCRTVFISTLGKSYLGIGGLFSNILSMLSLAELGVGTAMLFKLYEPLANNNRQRIQALMKFYKQIYRIIAIVIAAIGLCLIPFLPYIISDYDTLGDLGLNATLIFLLYLANSVYSYMFFAYRSAIIKADQKEYMLTTVSYVVIIVQNVLQMISLVLWKNFIIYLLIMIIASVSQNIVYAIIAQIKYPYINEKNDQKLEKTEVKEIVKDCQALLLYKINGVVLKSTDNIVLSAFMGLTTVAEYSNYYIFYTTINTLFTKVFDSVGHSIGNLHTTHNNEYEYKIFKSMELITMLLGGMAFVGIALIADELIETWIGSDWVIGAGFSAIMGFEIFTLSLRLMLSKYRNTMGLFQQAKYRPLVGAIVNIVLSIILVNYIGVTGVILGTVIADWSTFMVFDPVIIHKYGFKNEFPARNFYLRLAKYLLVIIVIGFLDWEICNHVLVGFGWLSVFVHIIIVAVTVPISILAISWNKPECRYLVQSVISRLKKK